MAWNREKCVKCCSIVGAHFSMTPLSFLWIYGNLFAYMDSYFRFSCHRDCVDIDPEWILCLYMAMGCPGAILSKFATDRLGQKWVGIVSAVVGNAAMLGSAWTISMSVAWTSLLMGAVFGLAVGFFLAIAFQNVSRWSPSNASVFMATATSVPSALSMLQNQLLTAYVNPDNVKPDVTEGPKTFFSQPQVLARVPKSIAIFACSTLCLQLIGYFLLTSPPKNIPDSPPPVRGNTEESIHSCEHNDQKDQKQSLQSVEKSDSQIVGYDTKHNGANREYSYLQDIENGNRTPAYHTMNTKNGKSVEILKDGGGQPLSMRPFEVVKTPVFYALFLFALAQAFALMLKGNYYKEFGLLYIHDDNFLTLIGTLLPIATTLARILYGLLIGKCILSIKDAAVLTLALNGVFCAFWYFVPQVNAFAYLILIMCLAFAQSSYYVVIPAGCLRIFGPEHFSTNYGLLLASSIVVGFVGPLVISSLLQVLGWLWLFALSCIITLIALAFAVFTNFDI